MYRPDVMEVSTLADFSYPTSEPQHTSFPTQDKASHVRLQRGFSHHLQQAKLLLQSEARPRGSGALEDHIMKMGGSKVGSCENW